MKDTIAWNKYEMAPFYKTLTSLRKSTPALSADASFQKLKLGDENAVYAFIREKDGQKVLVILNLSKKEQHIKIEDASLTGNPLNVFLGSHEKVDPAVSFAIEPWGYIVYDYHAK
jgi:alpha-amylase